MHRGTGRLRKGRDHFGMSKALLRISPGLGQKLSVLYGKHSSWLLLFGGVEEFQVNCPSVK